MKTKAEHASKKALFQASVFLLDGFYFILFFYLEKSPSLSPKKEREICPFVPFFSSVHLAGDHDNKTKKKTISPTRRWGNGGKNQLLAIKH